MLWARASAANAGVRVIGILRLPGTKPERNTSENGVLAAGTKLFPRAPAAHAIPTPYFLVSADFDFVAVAVSFFAS